MASRKRPTRKTETAFANKTQGNNSLPYARPLTLAEGHPTLPHSRSLRPPPYGNAANLKPVSPSRPVKLSPTAAAANQSRRKKDAKMRRLQASVYDFLERPKDYKSIGYQLVMFLMALLCLLLSVLATVDKYEKRATDLLIGLEVMMIVWFTVEFVLRMWSAGCRSRYQNLPGRLQFFKRPLCLLDITVILSGMTILCIRSEGQIFTSSALGGLRFFQILRMLRIDRRGGSWKLLGSVIWAHRQELFTTLYIGFLGLIFFSFLIYIVEKDKNPARFGTYPDALWWGVVTLCTVGYGDAVPVTWLGKLVASCCALLGISFFALPAGILGSGFALKVQQQQRQKHLTRRKGPAAVLIQSLWRCHAAEESFNSTATWLVHVQRLSPKTNVMSTSSSCQKFRMNSSFISRLSIRRKEGYSTSHHLSSSSNSNNNNSTSAANNNSNNSTTTQQHQQQQPTEEGRRNLIRRTYSGNNAESSSRYALLNARSKLKRSHISFQDVVVLQSSPIGDRKEADGDVKNDDNNDDALQFARVDHLTSTHKTAIRAIRKIKFFVARRIFKEALKPYDVKDVIEQYTAGHLDMLTRVKDLQTRLDLIVGQSGSTSPEVTEGRLSMASRIMKIEKQVSCIESKLDSLVEMHRTARGESSIHTRTDSLPSNQSSECNDAEPTTSSRRLFGLSHFSARCSGGKQHHERAYKQLSEPLSSSESMRKESNLAARHEFDSSKRSAELSSDRLHFLGSQQSIDPSAGCSNKLRWRQNAPLEAFDSHDIVRSEIMLNRLQHFDSDERPNAIDQIENKKRRLVDNQLTLDQFPATNKSKHREETCIERQTLYTLSEHTSAASNTWSNSGTASTDVVDLCKAGTKERDQTSTYSSSYQSDYRIISTDDIDNPRIGRENDGLSLELERSTPDIVDTNEYEPLLPDSQDCLDSRVGCKLIKTKCCHYLDASKHHHGWYNGEPKSAQPCQNKLAAIPLLDPLFVKSSLSNQCPSIFLTMPSNERISSVEEGCSPTESLLDESEKGLATISRSISALCTFDELLRKELES